MNDFRLQVFFIAAQTLSFTETSEKLHVSQPAISKHIKELEDSLKIRLFNRNKNSLSLTAEGELLYGYAEKILGLYQQANFEIGIIQKKISGNLTLGASTTIAQYILPPMLAKFKLKFPDINIVLINGNTREIEQHFDNNSIDLGLVEGITNNPLLKYTPFIKDELVAITSTAHRKFLRKEEISLQELKNIPLVLREPGSGSLEILEQAMARHHIKITDLKVVMQLGSTESIKLFLKHNPSLGFVSIHSVSDEIAEGKFKVLEVPELNLERMLHFAHPHGVLGGIANIFKDYAASYNF